MSKFKTMTARQKLDLYFARNAYDVEVNASRAYQAGNESELWSKFCAMIDQLQITVQEANAMVHKIWLDLDAVMAQAEAEGWVPYYKHPTEPFNRKAAQ